MSNSITITGSTIGAMAVGAGATANSCALAVSPAGQVYAFEFKAEGATREQIATWLRRAADIVADHDHPVMNDARAFGSATRAWTLTPTERR